MTPVPRHDYRIGVPHNGSWHEIFNSDSGYYGGSNVGNDGRVVSSCHHRPWATPITATDPAAACHHFSATRGLIHVVSAS